MNTPFIKWTGSKRHIAKIIISYFPKDIEVYYEPFLGGGSVFFQLLKSGRNVKKFELSDKNKSLIEIFQIAKDDPSELISSYREKWNLLQKSKDFFYEERDFYNKTKDPKSFYFLTRTCYNGTIRFNSKGDFNTAYHFGRAGMSPDKIEKTILFYNDLMKGKDISFIHRSFEEVVPTCDKDVVYLDPPYTNTKALYHGNISLENLLKWIKELNCSWFMNINGINSKDNEEDINIEYSQKVILSSGNSSFSRMKGKSVEVGEYFYMKSEEIS